MTTRFPLPEAGLSRAARWCLLLDGVLLLVLLLWLSYSPDVYEQGRPPVELPVARILSEDGPYPEDDRLILSVTRDGRVWRAHEPLDPDVLDAWLEEQVLAYDAKRRAKGKTGIEDVGGGRSASRLHVLLRVDRAAPWGAVHDLLRHVGQASLYKVKFLAARERRSKVELRAFLPTRDLDPVYITAHVRSGSVTLDGRTVPDLTAAIKATPEDYDDPFVWLVDADRDVAFGDVIRVLDDFACAGTWRVDLAAGSVRAVAVPR
jgi:biopolymer transport protein ExbD